MNKYANNHIGSGVQRLTDPPFTQALRDTPLSSLVGVATSRKGDVYFVESQRILKISAVRA